MWINRYPGRGEKGGQNRKLWMLNNGLLTGLGHPTIRRALLRVFGVFARLARQAKSLLSAPIFG